MDQRDYDAIIVGSGPNGLAAAITLQREGLSVLLVEGARTVGGGLRSAELTLPGFIHDICSAIHPLAVSAPFFADLPLDRYGLEFIYPPLALAHPFDSGKVAWLCNSVERTIQPLGNDASSYHRLIMPLIRDWDKLFADVLAPLHIPAHPLPLLRFGFQAIRSARSLIERFSTQEARGLLAGISAHAMQPLSNLSTAAIALVLAIAGHVHGWPLPKGGSQRIADALAAHFMALGGEIQTGFQVQSLQQLPSSHAVLLDVTPRQLLQIAGHSLSALYRWQLRRFRYGMGICKIDWALDGTVPFTAAACREAGTLHIGNTFEEIMYNEKRVWQGYLPERPFVIMAQPSLFDPSRAPEGKHTAWAYCHMPHGADQVMTEAIEKQVERFAPGFRDRILARHVMSPVQLEAYNPNYVGGDINGGVEDIRQLFTRPALRWSPYRSSAKGIYLCSSSTPPGGGVHGMCGYHAAQRALRDIFR